MLPTHLNDGASIKCLPAPPGGRPEVRSCRPSTSMPTSSGYPKSTNSARCSKWLTVPADHARAPATSRSERLRLCRIRSSFPITPSAILLVGIANSFRRGPAPWIRCRYAPAAAHQGAAGVHAQSRGWADLLPSGTCVLGLRSPRPVCAQADAPVAVSEAQKEASKDWCFPDEMLLADYGLVRLTLHEPSFA